MKKVIRIHLLICQLLFTLGVQAQSYDSDMVAVRMYTHAPFEGVRAVNDYANAYLISVLTLDKAKYKTEYTLNRVASVKAMAQASRFLNGSNISQEMIIHTTNKNNGTSDSEIIENIRENSIGYAKNLELLTNFKRKDGMQVFIFMCPLAKNSIQKKE